MTGERARRLSDLFQRALDVPLPEREAWLVRECADDVELRGEAAALLAADTGDAANELEALTTDATGRPRPGELIAGRYRLLHQIGEGGMGIVFAAEQLEPQRRVALKFIRPGWLDADAQQRFRREAQALGRLQHPGIAQVFEAGVAPGSPPLPFLAMEFVDGVGLAQFARGLALRGRIETIAAIAEAVGHAHERGVVHRDLKPSNVMVETGSTGPRVRVLDFGVARFVGDDAATLHTRSHQLIGTLAYMSPEQLELGSNRADARSDVWSLGVTAYELLAGTLPLPLGGKSLAETARMLRDDEPVRLDKVVPALRGDVATVVNKALAKDPTLRYANAAELAADLRRYLADEPITARPPSVRYQVARFARRHRGLVAGLAATFVALVAGLVVAVLLAAQATRERDRANQRTNELREMVRTLVLDVDRELATLPGATKARRALLVTGRKHAEGMAADAGDDPELLTEVASLYGVLASVESRPGDSSLGDSEAAVATLRQAFELLDRAIAAAPAAVPPRFTRFRLLTDLDSLLRGLRRNDERDAVLDDQQRTAARLATLVPAAEAEHHLARAAANRSRWHADHGRFAEALPGLVTLRDLLVRDVARSDDRENRDHARTLTLQIAQLHDRLGQADDARVAYTAATAQSRAAHERHGDLSSARDFGTTLRAEAMHHLQKKAYETALPLLQEARELVAPLVAADAADVELQRLLRTIEFGLGSALVNLGELDEGGALLHAYLKGMTELAARFPSNRALQRELVPARQHAAQFEAKVGRFERALEIAASGVQHSEVARRQTPQGAMEGDDLLMSLGVYASIANSHAGAAELAAEERARLRTRAADAFAAQLHCAQELERDQLLEPRRRYLLDELPPRIAALRQE